MKNRVDECDVTEPGCTCEACTGEMNRLGVVQVELTGAEVATIGIELGRSQGEAGPRRIRAKMLAADNVFRARDTGTLRDGTKVDRLPVPPPGAPEFGVKEARAQRHAVDALRVDQAVPAANQQDPQAGQPAGDIRISITVNDVMGVAMSGIGAPAGLWALLRPLLHKMSKALREAGHEIPVLPEHGW